MQIVQTDYYENNYRDANDNRVVQEDIQRTVLTLITHRKLLITTEINNPINHTSLFIGRAFLKKGGKINENQQLRLISCK